MPTIAEPKIKPILLKDINLDDRTLDFRLRLASRTLALRREMKKIGQLTPVTLQEMEGGALRVVDGFTRLSAIRFQEKAAEPWGPIQAEVLPHSQTGPEDLFRVLHLKNFFGEGGYGLMDKSRCLDHFYKEGLTLSFFQQETGLPFQTLEDLLDLNTADAFVALYLNWSPMEPVYAAVLHRRFSAWAESPFKHQALRAARELIRAAEREPLTMKSWRMLLDFYWDPEKPGRITFN